MSNNKVILVYRLVGSVNDNRTIEKEFETREQAIQWAKDQGNILILCIESNGASVLKGIFG